MPRMPERIAVVGLGYAGLALATAFGKVCRRLVSISTNVGSVN